MVIFVQSLSRVQLFVTPMNCSMPGFPVLYCLLEFAQIHVIESIGVYHGDNQIILGDLSTLKPFIFT